MSESQVYKDEFQKIVYFRDRAVELGCENIDKLRDLAVWKFIIAHQDKQK